MDDSFGLGEPARRPARLGRARAPRAAVGPSNAGRLVAVLAVLGALVAGGVVVMKVMASGGQEAAEAARTAVDQIGLANDVAAQETARRVTLAAMAAYAETGQYPTAEALAADDPSLRTTSRASNGPEEASVAASDQGFAVAVASASGTCVWARIDPQGVTSYGSGEPCTGQAAMAASDPAW